MSVRSLELDRSHDGVAIVTLVGEHDLANAPSLKRALADAAGQQDGVVVELSMASFIDSSILGAIIGGLRRARELGLGYAIVVSTAEGSGVGDTLRLTGLLSVFPVYESREDAVAAAAAGRNVPAGFAP